MYSLDEQLFFFVAQVWGKNTRNLSSEWWTTDRGGEAKNFSHGDVQYEHVS